jgi:hypothetical protein
VVVVAERRRGIDSVDGDTHVNKRVGWRVMAAVKSVKKEV